MNRQGLNRVGAIVPVVFSLLALAVVLVVATTGWERHLRDEGAAAHIFQLLIVAEAPFILLFLVTANWRAVRPTARALAFQAAGLFLALGSVAVFKL